jgi:hypothetical protein
MKLEDLIERVDELIELGRILLRSSSPPTLMDHAETIANVEGLSEFRTASLSFISRVFEEESAFYKELDAETRKKSKKGVSASIGILKACQSEIEGGWLFTVRGLVASELFSDFLEMAEHLLTASYKDAAAVMIGGVLEEHLRRLCEKNSISVTKTKADGKVIPLTASPLNDELAKATTYTKLDQKMVAACLDLRNSAAHGKYEEYGKMQVEDMLRNVRSFITRVPI